MDTPQESGIFDKPFIDIFLEFLNTQLCAENLLFLIALKELKNCDGEVLEAKAQQIIDRFIRQESEKEINIDATTRKAVLASTPLTYSTFDDCESHVRELIIQDSIPKLLKNPSVMKAMADVRPFYPDIFNQIMRDLEGKIDKKFVFAAPTAKEIPQLVKRSYEQNFVDPKWDANITLVMLQHFYKAQRPLNPLIFKFLSVILDVTDKKEKLRQFREMIKSLNPINQGVLCRTLMLFSIVPKSNTFLEHLFFLSEASQLLPIHQALVVYFLDNLAAIFPQTAERATMLSWNENMFPQKEIDYSTLYATQSLNFSFGDTNLRMSQRDWLLIQSVGTLVQAKADQVLIAHKVPVLSTFMYYVISGEVVVEEAGSKKVVGPGKFCGELAALLLSELTDEVTPYAVTTTQPSTLLQLCSSNIVTLLSHDASVALRLCASIASKMARGLLLRTPTKINQTEMHKRVSKLMTRVEDTSLLKGDQKFQAKFNLPSDQLLVRQFACSHKDYVGTCYISQDYFCFEAVLFGLSKSRMSIPYCSIDVLSVGNSSTMTMKVAGKYRSFLFSPADWHLALAATKSFWKKSQQQARNKDHIGAQPKLVRVSRKADLLTASTLQMSSDDWKLVLALAVHVVNRDRGDTIIAQGTTSGILYQLTKGECSIAVSDGKQEHALGVLGEGTVLGDVSFLEAKPATATVIANSPVSLYAMDGNCMKLLFLAYPELGARFFYRLATQNGERILKLEKPEPDVSPSSDLDPNTPLDTSV